MFGNYWAIWKYVNSKEKLFRLSFGHAFENNLGYF